ncbi:hypothetical protein, partial [Nonomuraea sp. MG754425]|uniref:hypothetical protein n=1 Tax=Nonomuraea sp. MG754425 TaxID=2570319 RepID=UPI001F3F926A
MTTPANSPVKAADPDETDASGTAGTFETDETRVSENPGEASGRPTPSDDRAPEAADLRTSP